MEEQEKRYMMTGILGTVAVHLLLLVIFLAVKIGEVKTEHKEMINLELDEEIYKSIEEIIQEEQVEKENIAPLSNQTISNIVSNVADEMNKEISTEQYIEEVMKELGMEEMNPQHDNSLPDDPSLAPDKKEEKDEVKTNFGQTRITYNIPPKRKARYIDRPIYRCQDGGRVVVAVVVNKEGYVLQANVQTSDTNEECVMNMAISSAKNFIFEKDNNAANKVNGTITYIFVAQ